MTPAVASLIALLVAIFLSMVSRLNVGVLSIVFAWLIGVYMAAWKPEQVAAGFPTTLFLTLAGVALLFSLADANGTLERLTQRAVRAARGNARLLPIIFFILAFTISSVGPGAISSVALIIPLAMPICTRAGVSRFLTSLMVANGANAGNLSPVSSVGIIANTKMAEAGIGGHGGKVWFANLLAHAVVSLVAYVVLSRRGSFSGDIQAEVEIDVADFEGKHWLTIGTILAWILGVLVLKLNVGMAAFGAAALIVLANASDESVAMKKVPWGVIIMVCGVSVLIAVLEKTGGMELFSSMLAKLALPSTINGTIAFVTGLISSWSSTSGVVLPAFLPAVPTLVSKVGGGDPLAVALSINVGSALVDVSPLSTLGALCVATVSDVTESRLLFKKLLIWGLSMSVVGAIISQLMNGALARS
ncbi:MAG: SLC13 family permease, partial [Gemmatimonadaceae bacterium]